jgi:signal transduction histidine kinase
MVWRERARDDGHPHSGLRLLTVTLEPGLSRGPIRAPSEQAPLYPALLERERPVAEPTSEVTPVSHTLRWVVVLCRLVGWAWSIAMIAATLQSNPDVSRGPAIAAGVLGTLWAGLTVVGARGDKFIQHPLFVISDGVVAALLTGAGWAAGAPDFISGGYPISFLFVVAYATSLRWTMVAAVVVTFYSAFFHELMGMGAMRTVGSIQFLVVGLIAGWAFDTLRNREDLRLEAERNLRAQQEKSALHEERASTASRLHDSVLQTLQMLRMNADDPTEVRYLARRQERELRQMIDEYRSPYDRSFRAELLGARDRVEDICRVEIEAVIRDDAEIDPALTAMVAVAHEAMINAGKHSGSTQIHLYSEIANQMVKVNVRDRGRGFADGTQPDQDKLRESLNGRITSFGGHVHIESAAGNGTDVAITLPRP